VAEGLSVVCPQEGGGVDALGLAVELLSDGDLDRNVFVVADEVLHQVNFSCFFVEDHHGFELPGVSLGALVDDLGLWEPVFYSKFVALSGFFLVASNDQNLVHDVSINNFQITPP
jgi:hypothetical protein